MKRAELESFIMETYNAETDYPWLKYPNYEVFRHCNNRKWFALIMDVPKNKLGLQGEEMLKVVDFKCDPILIGTLREEPGFFPAYHMSKDSWITVTLDGSVSDDHIARQLLQIWSAVCCKSKRKLKFSPCTNLIFGIFFTDISRIIFPLIINYRWNILMFSFRLNNTDKFCSHKQRIICLAFFADSGICWPFSNRHVTTFRKSCTF